MTTHSESMINGNGRSRVGEQGLSIEYKRPAVDYGSIVAHTFTRCGGRGGRGRHGGPPKDFPDVPHHIDKFGECSALDLGGGLS